MKSAGMVLDMAQARFMGIIIQDTTAIGDLIVDGGIGRNIEVGMEWDGFGQV